MPCLNNSGSIIRIYRSAKPCRESSGKSRYLYWVWGLAEPSIFFASPPHWLVMKTNFLHHRFIFAVCLGLIWGPVSGESPAITPEQLTFFESKIRPLLVKECYSCHSSKTGNAKGGLRLDTEQLTKLGGNSGPAVVPGDLDASLIYGAISYQDFAMPPKGPLPETVVNDFRRWIEMGAPDPRVTEVATLNSTITDEDIAKAKAEFWAYQKPVPVTPPTPKGQSWVRSDIDRFVLKGLEDASMKPADDAESRTILRRLCFDLIGLPPSATQLESFTNAWAVAPEQAIADTVDELLDSPQFGERWGRHWLDLARYAESNGREVNMTFPHAWRYRDYVIDSFNADKPYDRFVQEQIAGDVLPAKTDEQWTQNLIATSFLAIGPKSLSEQNGAQFAAELADEQLDTTTRVFLGTSVACARCHDHKFDPITQGDYYSMAGIFNNTVTYFGPPKSEFGNVGSIQNRNLSTVLRLPMDDPSPFDKSFTKAEMNDMAQQVRDLRQELVDARLSMRGNTDSPVSIQTLIRNQTRIEALSSLMGSVDENGRPSTFCMGVQDREVLRDARVLVRGEIDQPAQVVPRGFPKVLTDKPASIGPKSSGRLELARWIGSKDHPITARVMVNRIWLHLIGTGLVRTPEDFGFTGQAPTHPELLDHLAIQFVDSGWSIKSMIRSIATSRVYRMSSQYDANYFNQDPDNERLWRANSRRLGAEAIRDSMLFVSGQLDLTRPRASEVAKVGYMQVRDGNLVNLGQLAAMPGEGMFDRGRMGMGMGMGPGAMRDAFRAAMNGSERIDMVDATYRSVYLPILRDELPRALEVFDFAEPSMVIGVREVSNTPNQALFMMNNEFVLKQSEAFARRVYELGSSNLERLEQAFLLAYGRLPTASEKRVIAEFAAEFGEGSRYRDRGYLTMVALCQSLFAAAEFRLVD